MAASDAICHNPINGLFSSSSEICKNPRGVAEQLLGGVKCGSSLTAHIVRTMQQQLNVILFLYILCQNATHTEASNSIGKRLATAAFGSILPQQLDL